MSHCNKPCGRCTSVPPCAEKPGSPTLCPWCLYVQSLDAMPKPERLWCLAQGGTYAIMPRELGERVTFISSSDVVHGGSLKGEIKRLRDLANALEKFV